MHVDSKAMKKTAVAYKRSPLCKEIIRHKYFYLLLLLPVVHFILFKYIPMFGVILGFRKFVPGDSMFGSEWVGLKYFQMFLKQSKFWQVFWNTLHLSIKTLVFTFPLPIVFALLLNELRSLKFKKLIQTVSYLPHFISTIVVAGMMMQLLSPSVGVVNHVLLDLGIIDDTINFMERPEWFRTLYIGSDMWQHTGWNAIIFLAALTGVDMELYEAASIDGANRFQRTIHITLPSIAPTIVIMLILSIGSLLSLGFEKVLAMQTLSNMETSDIISTYVYRLGIGEGNNYSFATAIGLFQGVIGLILLLFSNLVANKLTGEGLW